ncbi:hypothetical protein [Chelativorans intermedius]|uniref:Uncharacterized protein n=1 Tax=Chelativorans intermedius TaxID=515947 RepID=A0ABV6D7J4_9HYPH|nr:hypothetical protein [Chelativorans intermedius]MCT8999223.1 hypothetical protein [Chelativorans intermedius]
MDARPLRKMHIHELAAEFIEARAHRDMNRLSRLEAELTNRKSRRARNLAMNVRLALATLDGARKAA